MINYAIDIGNTRIKTATFQDGQLRQTGHFQTDEWAQITADLTNQGAKNIIYSTVANEPPRKWIENWKMVAGEVWSLDRNGPLPFASHYQSMETLGKDRIAAVAGALACFPQRHCLVVDAGTCMTLDLVTAEGAYLGGNISPGLQLRLTAMHEGTSRLPLVAPTELEGDLGRDTVSALQHGGQGGLVYEIEGLYRRLAAHYTPLHVVLTGGDTDSIVPHLTISYHLEPQLVLIGLNKILRFYADSAV